MFKGNVSRLSGLVLFVVLLLGHLFLYGCGESENDGGITGTGSPLESYLKNGMAAHNQNYYGCYDCLGEPETAVDMDAGAEDDGDSFSDGFSKTNTQESGVDELDWLKTDGEFVYSYNGGENINVFNMSETVGSQAPVNTISLDTERHYLRGLFLDETGSEEQLISIADEYQHSYSDYFWYWHESKSRINVYDLSEPETSIEEIAEIVIDGQYVSSRKIGSKLYVISQYSAQLEDYVTHPYSEEDIASNLSIINNATLEDLLPSITINGESATLIDHNDCHIPGEPEEAEQPTLALVTVIDLENISTQKPADVRASCVAASISTIYSSINSVYMVESEYQYQNGSDDVVVTETGGTETGSTASESRSTDSTTTDSSSEEAEGRYHSHIYKLDFEEDGVDFDSSVTVKGGVGWNQQFRLSEYQDFLRLVTTDHSATESNIHRLHTVQITDAGLSLAATIPNTNDTTAIGKPGERIYSVRFNAERAYIVTFRQIDPFYVIDLADPLAPKVAGELELPGFSNYLHPFGENLVFGLGKGAESGNSTNQIKVALFDVSDMNQPTLIDDVVLEGNYSYTPALYSHTALSILPASDNQSWRIGFAASIYESWYWQRDSYFLFEVTEETESSSASLTLSGEIVGTTSKDDANSGGSTYEERIYYDSEYDRGVLTGEHVHYSHNGTLITELWDDL